MLLFYSPNHQTHIVPNCIFHRISTNDIFWSHRLHSLKQLSDNPEHSLHPSWWIAFPAYDLLFITNSVHLNQFQPSHSLPYHIHTAEYCSKSHNDHLPTWNTCLSLTPSNQPYSAHYTQEPTTKQRRTGRVVSP